MNTPNMTHRAVLIAGGISPAYCERRYANNIAWWARSLATKGFSCRICHGNGSQHRRFKSTPFDALTSADRTNVEVSLSWLVEASGLALLLISNHGNKSGFNLWGKNLVSPTDLQDMLNLGNQTTKHILIMGQCYGGIFGSLANERTAVISASTEDELSFSCLGSKVYDEFLYQLGTALFGVPTYLPQSNPPPSLSLAQAFAWAKSKDRRTGSKDPNERETPTLVDPNGITTGIFL